MRRASILLVVLATLATVAPARATPVCVPTPRPDRSNPVLAFQREAFGFHDEELVLCSPGAEPGHETHIAARLWVPAECPGIGGCPVVLIAHGFGFNKEITLGDMLNGVRRGMYVLSYDVRGQGASGGQAALLGRDDVADQAALLRWLFAEVDPTRVGVYGISQGGTLAWMAALYNCGAARAAAVDPSIPCEQGDRWIDAIAPLQGPVSLGTFRDGTCTVFALQAIPYSRGNPAVAGNDAACLTDGIPAAEELGRSIADSAPFDFAFRELLPQAGAVDVPVYVGTSFNDRLVPPQEILDMYEALDARADLHHDLRLVVSNDGHGDIGANFAVLDDVFAWLAVQLGASDDDLRAAPVSIAQEWDGDSFRLEHAWPIPGSGADAAYLAPGALEASPGSDGSSELLNVPVVDSPPGAFFVGGVRAGATQPVPGARLVFLGPPAAATTELTGVPTARLWVSSSNAAGRGRAQVHVSLWEVTSDGEAHEIARVRRGLTGLGGDPTAIALRFSASSLRIEPGNRLMLSITPSDVTVAAPAWSVDSISIHHGATFPSRVVVPTAPADRVPPDGEPPSGSTFADDPLGTICSFFGQDC